MAAPSSSAPRTPRSRRGPTREKIDEVLADLAAVLGADAHPLLGSREGGKRLVVLITPDRGLAGPLNTNIDPLRGPRDHRVTAATSRSSPIGRKGRDAMRRARVPIEAHFAGFGDRPAFADVAARSPASSPTTSWRGEARPGRPRLQPLRLDARPAAARSMQLLPIEPTEDTEGIPGNQFIFEPSPGAVLEQLVPRYVATRLFQAVLEGKASEESSRMVAMKNATENAEDLIDDLTLAYNKVRQTNITREMIEIASGAKAR